MQATPPSDETDDYSLAFAARALALTCTLLAVLVGAVWLTAAL